MAANAHVAMISSPGMGLVIPLLEFAKCLVSLHGFHVTFFIVTTDASVAQSQLLQSTAIPDGLHLIDLPPADVSAIVPDGAKIETRLSIVMRETAPSLRSALAELPTKPTALIVDIFGSDALQMVAEDQELRMSTYVFFTASALLLALLMHLPALDRLVEGEYVHLPEPLQVPGCRPIQIRDLVDPLLDRTDARYTWVLHHASRFPMADGILANTCEVLEPQALQALRENPVLKQIPTPPVYPVGPVIRSTDGVRELQPEWMTWLAKQPPRSVLYVSFGSGGTLSSEQLSELALGLELSRQRFLWVVRGPKDEASATFFTSGEGVGDPGEYLPDGFLDRTAEIGRVVPSWAPQMEILRHPSVGGFLTHCGWNSTLESVVHGVPMIAWPLYAEQKINAAMLEENLKVAVRVRAVAGENEVVVVAREEVARAARLLMAMDAGGAAAADDDEEVGKEMRRRMEMLREEVARALEEQGSSYEALQQWKMRALGRRG